VDAQLLVEPSGAAGPGEASRAPDPAPGFADAEPAGGILLRLGTSRYTVSMSDVAEVVPLPVATRIPGAPAFLTGVANWRGRMLPVLDIRPLLRAELLPLASSARLLVVQSGPVTAGIVAEAVPGVYDASLDDAGPPPATLPPEAALLVSGQVSDPAGPIAVLDVDAILALRDRLDRRRHGG
jgi:twitching motility protein PilI